MDWPSVAGSRLEPGSPAAASDVDPDSTVSSRTGSNCLESPRVDESARVPVPTVDTSDVDDDVDVDGAVDVDGDVDVDVVGMRVAPSSV